MFSLQYIMSIFWSEWFWFGNTGAKWKDFENTGDLYHPQLRDMCVPLCLAAIVIVIRKNLERHVFTPFGLMCGITNERRRSPPLNPMLEKSYKIQKFPADDTIKVLSKQSDLSIRQVERWFRMRRNKDKPTTMVKFTESAWRFTYYFSIFVYGVFILWDKPWLWDTKFCWTDFPHHHISSDIYWYYMIEMSFYWALMFSQFADVKRKDFWEMFIHHCATIFLMFFSWNANFVRVGTLILVLHDLVDFWLEAAKMCLYCKKQSLCDMLFAVFAVMWFVTRLVVYPVRIMYTTFFDSGAILGSFPSMHFFNVLLTLLFILHIYWFSLIVALVYNVLTKKDDITDIRSDEEEAISEDIEEFSNAVNHNSKSSKYINGKAKNGVHLNGTTSVMNGSAHSIG